MNTSAKFSNQYKRRAESKLERGWFLENDHAVPNHKVSHYVLLIVTEQLSEGGMIECWVPGVGNKSHADSIWFSY